jgi:hypothetical protein
MFCSLRPQVILTPVFGWEYFPIRFPEVDALLEARLSPGGFLKLAFRCNFS